jgi:hypothetical protein
MNSKILTLIPAFRTDFLNSVFYGLSTQTYKNFKVIVADDSTNGIVSEYIRSGKYKEFTSKLDISIIRGAGSEARNHNLLLKTWDGNTELAHLHHDDDYIYPDFYRQHVMAHGNLDITLSASSRWIADREGAPIAYSQSPLDRSHPNERYIVLKPDYLVKSLLVPGRNWIGEFSNVVISRKMLGFLPSLPSINDPYWGMLDMSMYLTNCGHGHSMAYIRDHLSVYRRPVANVEYRNPNTLSGKTLRFAWIAFSVQAWQNKMLNDEDFLAALSNSLKAYAVAVPADDMMNSLADSILNANGNLLTIADLLSETWSTLRTEYRFSKQTEVSN